jgi:hypothetical protein
VTGPPASIRAKTHSERDRLTGCTAHRGKEFRQDNQQAFIIHKMRVRKDYEKILPRNDASLTDSRKWLMMGMFPPQAKIKRNLRSGVRDSV